MLEYLGYLASTLILVSILMSSAKKLRWINLFGGIIFAIYGYLIHALPVGIMNSLVSIVNIYYLYKMYSSKDYFKLLPIEQQSVYLKYFLDYYRTDIEKFFPTHDIDVDASDFSFYILRNVVPAGFVVGTKFKEDILRIDFDYVVPTYRDFKMGEYLYQKKKQVFLDKGFQSLVTFTDSEKHKRYLNKMGFYPYPEWNDSEKLCYRIDLKA
ncbi:MAG: YgjV family protein [Bacilli bacterium]|nr:YgjV family protein [Bacilli bacterium]MBN2876891.1 YgjV family protein [Bacilli bacterium]